MGRQRKARGSWRVKEKDRARLEDICCEAKGSHLPVCVSWRFDRRLAVA